MNTKNAGGCAGKAVIDPADIPASTKGTTMEAGGSFWPSSNRPARPQTKPATAVVRVNSQGRRWPTLPRSRRMPSHSPIRASWAASISANQVSTEATGTVPIRSAAVSRASTLLMAASSGCRLSRSCSSNCVGSPSGPTAPAAAPDLPASSGTIEISALRPSWAGCQDRARAIARPPIAGNDLAPSDTTADCSSALPRARRQRIVQAACQRTVLGPSLRRGFRARSRH